MATPRRTARQWVSTLTGITMTLTAMVTILFGPDYNAENADGSFLGLSTQVLDIIHWVLNSFWLLTFTLFALFGKWSQLPPFKRKCHRLVSITLVGLLTLPAVGITTLHPIRLSYYPIAVSVIVELIYLSIEVTCEASRFVIVLAWMFLQAIGRLLSAIWNQLGELFRVRFDVHVG